LLDVAGKPNFLTSLGGQVFQVLVNESLAGAGFGLARKHSEHRNPVLAHEAGSQGIELLTEDCGMDVGWASVALVVGVVWNGWVMYRGSVNSPLAVGEW
jgi:hypothetical protein